MKRALLFLSLLFCFTFALEAQSFKNIVLRKDAHPAVKSAAEILAENLNIPKENIHLETKVSLPKEGTILLDYGNPSKAQLKFIGQDPEKVEYDGYLIKFDGNRALVFGKRPRSLLYAAGDVNLWKNRSTGVYVRQPAFKIRDCSLGDIRNESVAEKVAMLGANTFFVSFGSGFVTLKTEFPQIFENIPGDEQAKILKEKNEAEAIAKKIETECHNADVEFYPFLYGNNIYLWSPALAKAIYKVYPQVRGKRAPHSWEKAAMNPSVPETWKIMDAFVKEFVETLHGDGLITTFWDHYGIFSQDSLSVADSLNKFNYELEKNVGEYYKTLHSINKPLIVRTWSSGRAHWVTLKNDEGEMEHQFVHAPGYGSFSGSRTGLWGKVVNDVPSPVILQTKVYFSDCFPDARFNTFIGKAGNHTQIVEYQIVGQTTGRYFLPAVNVHRTETTMQKAWKLIGSNGGVSTFWGGTYQVHYNLFKDIINGINIYAWREFSWNINADSDKVWMSWAVPIYGEKAAQYIVKALKLSEAVADKLFSTLGFGYDTNSNFPGTIYRREVLLMYTNRVYLPEYSKYLEPSLENIMLVIKEKNQMLRNIGKMFDYLEKAKPFLTKAQFQELQTRFNWLKYEAIENKESEVSYWRFRYVRYLYSLRNADPSQLDSIAQSYHKVIQYKDSLFQYNDDEKFSCYDLPLDEINKIRTIGLGDPVPMMKEIYDKSKQYTEEITGPDFNMSDR